MNRAIAPKERNAAEAILKDYALDEAKALLAATIESAFAAGARPRALTEVQGHLAQGAQAAPIITRKEDHGGKTTGQGSCRNEKGAL